eukprot:5969967-Amphidinium_carterae.1
MARQESFDIVKHRFDGYTIGTHFQVFSLSNNWPSSKEQPFDWREPRLCDLDLTALDKYKTMQKLVVNDSFARVSGKEATGEGLEEDGGKSEGAGQ